MALSGHSWGRRPAWPDALPGSEGDIQPDMPGYYFRGGHYRRPCCYRSIVSHRDHPQHLYSLRINQRSTLRGGNHETRRSEAQPL